MAHMNIDNNDAMGTTINMVFNVTTILVLHNDKYFH